MLKANGFQFGIEAEYLLANAKTYEPLWFRDFTFHQLHTLFEQISLNGLPSLSGLDLEVFHKKIMPYTITGYPLYDEVGGISDFFPKGVEIRTPICDSIEQSLESLEILYKRMQTALVQQLQARAIAISHHPIESHFEGPQGNRTHERWQWAMQVMNTYGPDVNISLPAELASRLDLDELHAKVDYYAPAMVVLSLASPFYQGKPWMIQERYGKSYRTYRRSIVAPALRVGKRRLEFKSFEMSSRLSDYRNYMLLFLTLLLDDGQLDGRACKASRIYELGSVAQFGFNTPGIKSKLQELLEKAPSIIEPWGFSSDSLGDVWAQLEQEITPADVMLRNYHELGQSISNVMRTLADLTPIQVYDPRRVI